MPIGLVHDHLFVEHDPGSYHPESPQRLIVMDQALASWPGLERSLNIPLRAAGPEELGRVHQSSHLNRMASTEGRCVGLDPDTHTSPKSYEAALKGAGSLIDLCDAALEGRVEHGMALVRPPGHHATPVRAMGFCLFNNVAVAASHLVEARGLERVLIVDWDVHHGNGTEDAFYLDPKVLYFSTHQWPFYPGTGAVNAVGGGFGAGFNINVPMAGGHGDADFIRIFQDLLEPVAIQYEPQFILLSAGFDAHRLDPLGGQGLTSDGYAALARVLGRIAQSCCPGRVVGTLEGGYSPEAEARSILKVMDALMGDDAYDELLGRANEAGQPRALTEALAVARQYWKL